MSLRFLRERSEERDLRIVGPMLHEIVPVEAVRSVAKLSSLAGAQQRMDSVS